MEKLIALTVVITLVVFAAAYALVAFKSGRQSANERLRFNSSKLQSSG